MFAKYIELAFHLVAIGGLAGIVMLWEHGASFSALGQTAMICACILMMAVTLHLGMKMVNKK
jgi:hypothetical protein